MSLRIGELKDLVVSCLEKLQKLFALEMHLNIFIRVRNPLAKHGGVLAKIWTVGRKLFTCFVIFTLLYIRIYTQNLECINAESML